MHTKDGVSGRLTLGKLIGLSRVVLPAPSFLYHAYQMAARRLTFKAG